MVRRPCRRGADAHRQARRWLDDLLCRDARPVRRGAPAKIDDAAADASETRRSTGSAPDTCCSWCRLDATATTRRSMLLPRRYLSQRYCGGGFPPRRRTLRGARHTPSRWPGAFATSGMPARGTWPSTSLVGPYEERHAARSRAFARTGAPPLLADLRGGSGLRHVESASLPASALIWINGGRASDPLAKPDATGRSWRLLVPARPDPREDDPSVVHAAGRKRAARARRHEPFERPPAWCRRRRDPHFGSIPRTQSAVPPLSTTSSTMSTSPRPPPRRRAPWMYPRRALAARDCLANSNDG